MTAVLQQVHQDSTAPSLQPSLFAGQFPTLSLCSGRCHSNLWSLHDSSQLSPFVPAHSVCLSFPAAELSAVEGVSKQVSGLQ